MNTLTKLIRLPEVMARLGCRTSKVWNFLNPKSPRYDPTFPKPIKIGKNSRATYWVEDEIENWLRAQIQKSREQDSGRSPAVASMLAARGYKL